MRRQHTTNRGCGRVRRLAAALVAIATAAALAVPAGAAVAPDPDFGGTGLVLTDFTGGSLASAEPIHARIRARPGFGGIEPV